MKCWMKNKIHTRSTKFLKFELTICSSSITSASLFGRIVKTGFCWYEATSTGSWLTLFSLTEGLYFRSDKIWRRESASSNVFRISWCANWGRGWITWWKPWVDDFLEASEETPEDVVLDFELVESMLFPFFVRFWNASLIITQNKINQPIKNLSHLKYASNANFNLIFFKLYRRIWANSACLLWYFACSSNDRSTEESSDNLCWSSCNNLAASRWHSAASSNCPFLINLLARRPASWAFKTFQKIHFKPSNHKSTFTYSF